MLESRAEAKETLHEFCERGDFSQHGRAAENTETDIRHCFSSCASNQSQYSLQKIGRVCSSAWSNRHRIRALTKNIENTGPLLEYLEEENKLWKMQLEDRENGSMPILNQETAES